MRRGDHLMSATMKLEDSPTEDKRWAKHLRMFLATHDLSELVRLRPHSRKKHLITVPASQVCSGGLRPAGVFGQRIVPAECWDGCGFRNTRIWWRPNSSGYTSVPFPAASYFLAQKSILETTPARRLRELYPVERENPLR